MFSDGFKNVFQFSNNIINCLSNENGINNNVLKKIFGISLDASDDDEDKQQNLFIKDLKILYKSNLLNSKTINTFKNYLKYFVLISVGYIQDTDGISDEDLIKFEEITDINDPSIPDIHESGSDHEFTKESLKVICMVTDSMGDI